MNTPNTTWILIAAAVLIGIGIYLGILINRKVRNLRLKKRFGPEYERILMESGDARQVDRELTARLARVRSMDIRALSQDETARFKREWKLAQAQFVDEPLPALEKANRLIREVMQTRGYEVEDLDQRAADLSVDYPDLVEDLRGLHDLMRGPEKSRMNTEDMRQALLQGRKLFEELSGDRIESILDRKEKNNGRNAKRSGRTPG